MAFLDGIPNILYKYRDWDNEYHRRILTHNEIYLPSPDQFNDPFDCLLPYKYKQEDMMPDNIFRKLRSLLKREYPDMPEEEVQHRCYERQSSGAFENGRYWKEFYETHKEGMIKNFGVFCTTSENDNLLMWSHYANCHRGFCIGFDKTILTANIFATLGPVIYSKTFPEFDLFHDEDKDEGKGNHSLIALLYTKYCGWAYEKEYRYAKIHGANAKINYNPEAVKEVVLGLKMEEKDKKRIVDLVRARFPRAELYQSAMDLESFKLIIDPVLAINQSL